MKNLLLVFLTVNGILDIIVGSAITGMDHLFWIGVIILFCVWIIVEFGGKTKAGANNDPRPKNHHEK